MNGPFKGSKYPFLSFSSQESSVKVGTIRLLKYLNIGERNKNFKIKRKGKIYNNNYIIYNFNGNSTDRL